MEATEYMYSGLPIGSVGRLSNHPESQPICDRDKKIPMLKPVLIFPNKFLWYLYKYTLKSIMKTDTPENFKNCTKCK